MRPEKKRWVLAAVLQPILFAGCATGVMAQSLTVFDAANSSNASAPCINNAGDGLPGLSQGYQTPELVLDANAVWSGVSVTPPSTTGNFTVFDAPNAINTYVWGLNDKGDVAGYVAYANGEFHRFVRDRKGNITVFDPPNATLSPLMSPLSLNNEGDIAGTFEYPNQVPHGFVRDRHGNFTVIDEPDAAVTLTKGTLVAGINNSGEVTGSFSDAHLGIVRGFLLVRDVVWKGVGVLPPGTIGDFIAFDPPNSYGTFPGSINDDGKVAGVFYDASQAPKLRGFVRDRRGGITVFDVPNASPFGTTVLSINTGGDVAGWFADMSTPFSEVHGFVRDRKGKITVFDPPNSGGTFAQSLNAGGDVAGYFIDRQNQWRGFVRDSKGKITAIDPPNSSYTQAININDGGDVAGYFTDSSQNKGRGFVLHRGCNGPEW